jgi:hypothetical protein
MPEPIRNPMSASLAPNGALSRTLVYRIRARLQFINAHIFIVWRFMRGPDQLIRFEPSASVTLLAPDTLESDLPDNKSRLIKMRNQTALITYDLATNTRGVSKSYDD